MSIMDSKQIINKYLPKCLVKIVLEFDEYKIYHLSKILWNELLNPLYPYLITINDKEISSMIGFAKSPQIQNHFCLLCRGSIHPYYFECSCK